MFITGTSIIVIAACFKFSLNPDSLYKLMYGFIYYFSVCQIKCNKLVTYFNNSNTPPTNKERQIYYYINGQLQEDKERKVLDSESESESESNWLIVSENGLSRIVSKSEDITTDSKESNVKFIALTISYDGEKYPIFLKEYNYNFYVVGNVLDKTFFHYYLRILLNTNTSLMSDVKSFTYELEIIDNDVNIQIINETKSIVLNEDGYLIV
jgi:hypothetical protein